MQVVQKLMIAAIAAGAVSARGQDVVVPRVFFWGTQPQGTALNPQLTSMVTVKVDTLYDPEAAAVQAANNALSQIAAGLTPSEHLCVILHNFGHDFNGSESSPGQVTRFFREADRLPGLLDGDFPINDGYSNRSYRHPFLLNATPQSPLRAWMQTFVTKWKNLQASNPSLPTPTRWFFDTEVNIALPGNPNPLHMLWYLSSEEAILPQWAQWSTSQVPGFAAGTTMASLYANVRAQYGWPVSINGAGGINPELEVDDATNRPFMIWYYQITRRVEDAVMDNCLYSVVKAGWPNASIRVGNYDAARLDGNVDSTGWFMDRTPSFVGPPAERIPANRYPRSWIEMQPRGGEMLPTIPLAFDPDRKVRWLAGTRWAFGDVDSPALYSMALTQLMGFGDVQQPFGNGWIGNPLGTQTCHQQPNLYLPGWPLDTTLEPCPPYSSTPDTFPTALRLARHKAESIINSFGGDHSGRLVPWLEMAWTQNPDAPGCVPADWRRLVTPPDLRAMLAMLRAKRMKEACMWTNWNAQNSGTLAHAQQAWNETARAITEVYRSRVTEFKRYTGTVPTGSDPQIDPAMLEFTLRSAAGLDYTVDIESLPSAATPATELVVSLDGFLEPVSVPTRECIYFEINVECTTTHPSTLGAIEIWDYLSQTWRRVMVNDIPNDPYGRYIFSAPLDPSTGRYELRRRFIGYVMGVPTDEFGNMQLRLIHTAPSAFTSRYDLVQVIRTSGPCPTTGEIEGESLESDVNFDEVIDENDLGLFLSKWSEGAPGADSNMDEEVDDADLLRFLNAYVTGT